MISWRYNLLSKLGNMKKKILIILVLITVMFSVSAFSTVENVSAQEVQQCLEGTGPGTGTACVPCNMNPYGICVPVLGIIDTDKISLESVILAASAFGAGLLLVNNGLFIRKWLKGKQK